MWYCDICGLYGDRNTIAHIYEKHLYKNSLQLCSCGVNLRNVAEVVQHLQIAHFSYVYICESCDYICGSQASIEEHVHKTN